MGNSLGKYFVQKAFNNNSMEIIKEIIANLKQAVIDRIPKISWLDKTTAGKIIKEIDNINYEEIGYPDYILKPKELFEMEYNNFEIDSNVFLNTIVNFEMFYSKKFGFFGNDDKWRMLPQVIFNIFIFLLLLLFF